jgi:gliding motility-associated-like protein
MLLVLYFWHLSELNVLMRQAFLLLLVFSSLIVRGQSYTITAIPYAPQVFGGTLAFVGTTIDDAVAGPFPIGFEFCFYGDTYTEAYIGSNGWVSFSPGQTTAFTSASIPSTAPSVPRNCVMGPWQDWYAVFNGIGGITYATIGTAPFRKFVATFFQLPMWGCTANQGTFQIVLNECVNTIEVHILQKPPCSSWGGTAVLGLHNVTGTVAHTVPGRNSTNWTVVPTAPEGWLFEPDASCAAAAFAGFVTADTTETWPVIEVDCYTNEIPIGLNPGGVLLCNSIDPGGSDFRLYTPQGQLMQIFNVNYSCVDGRTDSLTIAAANQFFFNGDHYLVIRNGLDGNPLMSECGTGTQPFDTIIVRVRQCFEYFDPVDMRSVSVTRDNEAALLTWNVPVDFDSSFFEAYRVMINEERGSNEWREFARVTNFEDTTLYTSEIDYTLEDRDFRVILAVKYYGDIRAEGKSINNILLEATDDRLTNGIRGNASITWTEFTGWNKPYEVYLAAAEDTGFGELIGSTVDTFLVFEKPQAVGTYVIRVFAQDSLPANYVAWSNYVPFAIENREIEVPNVLTPNGDGINDVLLVEGLEFFPLNKVVLYNRWGQVVFKADNYKNDYVPSNLEAGNYIYVVELYPENKVKQGAIKIVK